MSLPVRRRVALIGVPTLLVLAVLIVFGVVRGRPQAAPPTVPATPTIDPRLILHPQQVPIRGTLAGGLAVTGTLYPGFPDRLNTLQLTVRGADGRAYTGGRIHLVATMRGMRMIPVKVDLQPHGGGYSGTLVLPMFGSYQANAVLSTAVGQASGVLTLNVPLPGL